MNRSRFLSGNGGQDMAVVSVPICTFLYPRGRERSSAKYKKRNGRHVGTRTPDLYRVKNRRFLLPICYQIELLISKWVEGLTCGGSAPIDLFRADLYSSRTNLFGGRGALRCCTPKQQQPPRCQPRSIITRRPTSIATPSSGIIQNQPGDQL